MNFLIGMKKKFYKNRHVGEIATVKFGMAEDKMDFLPSFDNPKKTFLGWIEQRSLFYSKKSDNSQYIEYFLLNEKNFRPKLFS